MVLIGIILVLGILWWAVPKLRSFFSVNTKERILYCICWLLTSIFVWFNAYFLWLTYQPTEEFDPDWKLMHGFDNIMIGLLFVLSIMTMLWTHTYYQEYPIRRFLMITGFQLFILGGSLAIRWYRLDLSLVVPTLVIMLSVLLLVGVFRLNKEKRLNRKA